MSLRVEDYFNRIGYRGTPTSDLATLRALVTAHINAVPFENFGVHLGEPMGTGTAQAWRKIVDRRRGGWCYEMNAVLGAVLGTLGFPVTRHACGVMRAAGSEDGLGGHLALTTIADGERWLVDVGFGSQLAGPLPLRTVERHDVPVKVALQCTKDDYWRFVEESPDGLPLWFDFRDHPADESLLGARCEWQRSAADSVFTRTLTVQIPQGEHHLALRNRTLTVLSADAVRSRVIEDRGEWAALLADTFHVPLDPGGLWDIATALEARSQAQPA